jgi:murein DD-endopeptidase MepM/ murein hydrolase activator NlpD
VIPGRRPASVASLVAIGLLVVLSAAGCHLFAPPAHVEPPLGHWYVVEAGETLADIARRAGVPEEDLLEVNGLHDAAEVRPGKLIFVLNGPNGAGSNDEPEGAPSAAGPVEAPAPPEEPARAGAAPAGTARFRWPVDTPRVTSLFGTRWGKPHEGIDLVAPIGTPVYAADLGEVVYAGNTVRGYGNMVVVKHQDDLMTVYAHNSVLLVKVGDHVAGGQRVALSGQSGRATGPHVHFEVRRGQTPRDPLLYLPGRNAKP